MCKRRGPQVINHVSMRCVWPWQRAALEEVARARCNGALRHQLARDLNKSAKDFHYVARVRPARRRGFELAVVVCGVVPAWQPDRLYPGWKAVRHASLSLLQDPAWLWQTEWQERLVDHFLGALCRSVRCPPGLNILHRDPAMHWLQRPMLPSILSD